MKLVTNVSAGLILMTAGAAYAQERTLPPKDPAKEAVSFETTPSEQYLMKSYGLTKKQAAQQEVLADLATSLSSRLSTTDRENFGGLYIERAPSFRVIVGFKDPEARNNFRETLDPSLRSVVQVRNVRRSLAEIESLTDDVALRLNDAGIDFHSFYEFKSDSIVVHLETDEKLRDARAALGPEMANSVQLRKGEVGKPFDVINGQPGDVVYGGWHWEPNGDPTLVGCSFAFGAKDRAGNAMILSAGHCKSAPYVWQGDHHIILSEPILDNFSGKYDYKGWVLDFAQTGPWVWYKDNAVTVPGYENVDNQVLASGPTQGYFKVVGTYGYYSQVQGDVICKSGIATGFTCGEIIDGAATWQGVRGWIKIAKSDQEILSWSGDSGGAVFTDFTSEGTIKAAGILSGGAYVVDYDANGERIERPCLKSDVTSGRVTNCWMVHMPIDRLKDDPNFGSIMVAQ